MISRVSSMELASFFTFVILLNNLIPISLYVSMEIVKFFQALRIGYDKQMTYEGKYAEAKTSNLTRNWGRYHMFLVIRQGH